MATKKRKSNKKGKRRPRIMTPKDWDAIYEKMRRRGNPAGARMVKRPKGWVRASAVKVVGNRVYIRRPKTRKAKR